MLKLCSACGGEMDPVVEGNTHPLCGAANISSPTLFDAVPVVRDAAATRVVREEAITRSDDHADDGWRQLALEQVRWLAERQEVLNVDDVWERLALFPEVQTHNMSALGPVMRRASSLGWIENTGQMSLSDRPVTHSIPRRIWRSLLFSAVPN